ncbi:MAG: endo-1,4-beta-xylanase [Chitinophagaceae bacterium]|nr:endo-1,4-beta-xylanase [Chitinophagaceae bacterium]
MKYNCLIFFAVLISAISCKKSRSTNPTPPTPPPADTATIKGTASFTTGIAINYSLMKNNSTYASLVKNQFDRVTFEYQMKHGANVQNNGTYNFTNTDDLVNIAQAAGLEIYGHTLVWHQNNNGNYLRSLTAASGPNLSANPDFENDFTNWSAQVSSTAPTSGNISIISSGAQNGTKAARVLVNTPGPDPWSIQLYSDNINVTGNAAYTLKFWAKAASASQSFRVVVQGSSFYAQQNQTLTTSWTEYSFPFTPTENAVSIKFHFPTAGDFYIDNLSVMQAGSVLNPTLVKNAMQDWITTLVTRYKGKVKAWDVVNEVIDEAGNYRTGTSANDIFYWYAVLGSSYIADAFNYAHAADPDAVLFINDYNLESSPSKLSGMITLVNQLKAASVPVHGIATQMHISINTPNASIDNMFAQLAATGLKVHVSELDIRINPGNATPFTATPALLDQQAQKYKYVAQSYKNNVPAAQRYGITVWNVTDADSWIVTSMGQLDFPCLFDAGYNKKPAYTQFRDGLK